MTAEKPWRELLAASTRLDFEPHNISNWLDETGRYAIEMQPEFPLAIKLFHYASRHFTPSITWHERLELFIPLDGKVMFRMGETKFQLQPGDVLLVDNMKPHCVLDQKNFDARVVVISFMPELVYSPGSPSNDYFFLLPFYAKVSGRIHLMHRTDEAADDIYNALTKLLKCYFEGGKEQLRATTCKAWFLVILQALARLFYDEKAHENELLKRRQLAARFNDLLIRIRTNHHERISVESAAKISGMSKAQFTRQFKRVTGVTFVAYLTHIRLSEAARLLRHTEDSIAEIAARTGFSDQSYFDRCFKREFKQTPRRFRAGKN
jgi:AraC-like DNA-binding protein